MKIINTVDMNISGLLGTYYSLSSIVMAVISVIMALFVIMKGYKDRNKIFWVCFTVTTGLWGFFIYLWSTDTGYECSLLFNRIANLIAIFIPLSAVLFTEEYIKKQNRIVSYLSTVIAFILFFSALLFPNKFIPSASPKVFFKFYPDSGIIFYFFSGFFALCMNYSLIMQFVHLKKISGIEKKRSFLIFIGLLMTISGGSVNFLPLFNINIFPFGGVFTLFYVILTSYSIIRYKAFEIDTVIHRTLLWFITSILLIAPLALIFIFGRPWINKFSWPGLTVFAVILFYIFLSYYKTLQPKIDHIFRRRKYDYYAVLANVVSGLGSVLDLNKIFSRLFKELRNILYINNAVIFIQNIQTGDYEKEKLRFGTDAEIKNKSVIEHNGILSSWINKSKTALEKDRVAHEPHYAGIKDEALAFMEMNTIEVFIPLVLGEKVIGFIGLGKKENLQHYTIKDVELLENMGRQMGISIENSRLSDNLKDKERIKKEMEIATTIQTAIAPPLPEHDELDIAAVMKPAEEVGGDYYDITFDKDKNLWFAIGDVSGHGVTPGLIMMMAETSLSTSLKEKSGITPREAIMAVNKVLCENIRTRLKSSYFMTMSFLKYAGKGDFVHSGAHLDILIYRSRSKTIERVKTEGIFLGIVPDIEKAAFESKFRLEKDDVMILYTDGITESRNKENRKELLGLERLQKIIMKYAEKGVEEIKDRILGHTLEWCGGKQDDDMTFMVVKMKK